MKQTVLMGGAAAMLLGLSAPGVAAEHPSWDYLSLEWVASGDIEVNTAKESLDGYRLEAAKALGEFAFVRAGSNAYTVDANGVDIDLGMQQLGLGFHYPMAVAAGSIDPWAAINYERVTMEGIVGTGAGIDIGVRGMLMPTLELAASGKVFGDLDFGDPGDADYTGYTISATFTVVPKVAIQGSFSNYELDFDDPGIPTFKYKDVIGLGVRLMY